MFNPGARERREVREREVCACRMVLEESFERRKGYPGNGAVVCQLGRPGLYFRLDKGNNGVKGSKRIVGGSVAWGCLGEQRLGSGIPGPGRARTRSRYSSQRRRALSAVRVVSCGRVVCIFFLGVVAVVWWFCGLGSSQSSGPFVYFLPFWYSWGSSGEPQFSTRVLGAGASQPILIQKSKRKSAGGKPLFLKHRESQTKEREKG